MGTNWPAPVAHRPDGNGCMGKCIAFLLERALRPPRSPVPGQASPQKASGVARWNLLPYHVPTSPAAAAKTRSPDHVARGAAQRARAG